MIHIKAVGEMPVPYKVCVQNKRKPCGAPIYYNENSKYKRALKECISRQVPLSFEPLSGPVELYISIYFPKGKKPNQKPDWDNFGKTICDACTGILFLDDAQVVSGTVVKKFGEREQWVVDISCSEICSKDESDMFDMGQLDKIAQLEQVVGV